MSLLCCTDSMPLERAKSDRLSAAEYDRIFAERQARFADYESRRTSHLNRNLRGNAKVISAIGHEQTGVRKGKGAVGIEQNGVLKRVVALSDGYRVHRTIPTQLGPYMIFQAGKAYVSSVRTGLHGVLPEARSDEAGVSP